MPEADPPPADNPGFGLRLCRLASAYIHHIRLQRLLLASPQIPKSRDEKTFQTVSKKILLVGLMAVLLAAVVVPYLADAKLTIVKPSDLLPGTGNEQPKDLILNIIEVILGIAGLVAVLFVIWGGFQYVTAGVNEELAEQGKKTLRNAIIGVVIIVLSFVIVNVIDKGIEKGFTDQPF